jgi:hypothetical protein
VWFWFQIFVIFWAAYYCEIPGEPNQGYYLGLVSMLVAWLATWLLSKAIDLCRAYRWRKQRQVRQDAPQTHQ